MYSTAPDNMATSHRDYIEEIMSVTFIVHFCLGKYRLSLDIFLTHTVYLLWEPYPSHHNGLFSPLLVLRDFAAREGRSISVLSEQYKTSYLFYVTLSFLCNIICYLISMFVFLLVTLSGATTILEQKLIFWRSNF